MLENLDVDILAGTLFMEMNDVSIRPARRQVTLGDGIVYEYGASGRLQSHHSIRRASILRAPNKSTTVWPGDFLEIEVPHADYDNTYAIEPRFDTSCPHERVISIMAITYPNFERCSPHQDPEPYPGTPVHQEKLTCSKFIPYFSPD